MGPWRDGFVTGGLGASLGCVYARLTRTGWGLSAPGAVDPFMVEARRLAQIGHDHARVVARLAVAGPDHLGLDHDAAVAVPRAGWIAGVGGLAACRAWARQTCEMEA